MPRQKRSYRPKVKGCAQCAQRRISCDRILPECGKCSSRGLECSGFGDQIRYRFIDSVNLRGKWAGKTIQDLCEKRETWRSGRERRKAPLEEADDSDIESSTSSLNSTIDDLLPKHSIYEEILDLSHERHYSDLESNEQPPYISSNFPLPFATLEDDLAVKSTLQGRQVQVGGLGQVSHPSRPEYEVPFPSTESAMSESLLDSMPSWKRELLLHFSEHIASEMLAIDGGHNGWRYIVLPLAHKDELVLHAVLTVSAFHKEAKKKHGNIHQSMDSRTPRHGRSSAQQDWARSAPYPQVLYGEAINGLQRRSNLDDGTDETRQATLTAVLVLLVAAMVTGRDDYATILGMLHSGTNIFGGEETLTSSDWGSFLVRQVRKMRVYAAPHISEVAGSETLATQAHWDHYFDCVRHCARDQSSGSSSVAAITDVMQQAHDIYLQEVGNSHSPKDSNSQIERFKQTLETLPQDGAGTHVLVWATFLAAAASTLQSHRNFFKRALLKHYARSYFCNLLRGINYLPKLWAKRDQGMRWTQLLSEARLFVM